MGLEAVTYPNDLDIANPIITDPRSEGDDHIRNLKVAVKNAFPGLAGRTWRIQTKASGYTLAPTDNMTVIRCTAAITVALTAAATIGNGFIAFIQASNGAVVLDPNASEEINGGLTLDMVSGSMWLVFCNGSTWYAFDLTILVTHSLAKLNLEDQVLTGGVIVTSKDLGTISTGTVTPDPGDRPMQHYINGGAHTLAPSANVGSLLLDVTNNGSAGAITTSGFTKVSGDAFTTTNGHKFRAHISIGNAGSFLQVQAFQ